MSNSRQSQFVLIAALSLSALLLGVFVGGWGVWYSSRERMADPEFLREQLKRVSPEDGEPANGPPPALVRLSVAQWKTIQPQRSIVGRLTEVRKVTVASEVTGKITEMPIEIGSPLIARETLIARVDDVWPRLALERSRSQVACIQAQLDYELLELKRHQKLVNRDAVSQSDVDSRQAKVTELQARLIETKAAVGEETERIDRSAITSPFDGTVIVKHVELGGHVSPGTAIVDVVSRGQVDAKLMVAESVINLIRVDQVLPIQIDALGEEVPGKVVSLTPYGPAASRTFPVRVRLDDQDGRLKVGMSVTARISTGPMREALVVSKDAVLVRPDGSTVWIAAAGEEGDAAEVQPVPVTVGVRMRDEYAVEPETDRGRELLTAGTSVVIEGAERLAPGQQVRIVRLNGDPGTVARPGATGRPDRPTGPAQSDGSTPRRQET
jgi:RND family efflux transporter MFP subunit